MILFSAQKLYQHLLVIFCFLLFSCSDSDPIEDPIDETKEPVIYVFTGQDSKGSISTFTPSDKTLTFRYTLPARPFLNVRMGEDIYIHSYPTLSFENHLQVVSTTPDIQVKKQGYYSKYITWNKQSCFTIADDKLIVSDNVGFSEQSFLRIIGKDDLIEQDTVNIDKGRPVIDLLVTNKQLFVSIGNQIKIYSLPTFKQVHTLDVKGPLVLSFTLDREDNILVNNGSLFKLDPRNPVSLISLGYFTSPGFRPAYNSDDNVLYNISPYAQPAPVAYGLRKMDLSSGRTEDIISGFDEVLDFDIKFVKYHAESQLIIIGGKDYSSGAGILKTFTKDGKLKQEYTVDMPVIDVF